MKNMLHIYLPLSLEREEKSLKPTIWFVVRGVLTLPDQGMSFLSLLHAHSLCLFPYFVLGPPAQFLLATFTVRQLPEKSVPEFMFSCSKRINRILK